MHSDDQERPRRRLGKTVFAAVDTPFATVLEPSIVIGLQLVKDELQADPDFGIFLIAPYSTCVPRLASAVRYWREPTNDTPRSIGTSTGVDWIHHVAPPSVVCRITPWVSSGGSEWPTTQAVSRPHALTPKR